MFAFKSIKIKKINKSETGTGVIFPRNMSDKKNSKQFSGSLQRGILMFYVLR
jgi:hypothetical protein